MVDTKTRGRQEVVRHSSTLMRWPVTAIFIIIGMTYLIAPKSLFPWDYARVLHIGSTLYILCFTSMIIVAYYKVSRKMAKYDANRLLPWHIVAISISYLMFVFSSTIRATQNWGQNPDWWGLPIALPASLLGAFALGIMWKYQLMKQEALKDVR